LYLLTDVEQTARQSIELIKDMRALMQEVKQWIRIRHPKIYSQDLLNNLFRHPYTKIDFVMIDLQVLRPTASNYLRTLVANGLLRQHKLGRSNYYINHQLVALLQNANR